jgi:hypothetical protein
MIDHELLTLFARQRREELQRTMERSRGRRPAAEEQPVRRQALTSVRPMREARREA